jgi:hypothetical protein
MSSRCCGRLRSLVFYQQVRSNTALPAGNEFNEIIEFNVWKVKRRTSTEKKVVP